MDSLRDLFRLQRELKELSRLTDSASMAGSMIDQRMLGQVDSLTRQLRADWRDGIASPSLDALEVHRRALLGVPESLMHLRADTIHSSNLAQAAGAASKDHWSSLGVSSAHKQLEDLAKYAASSALANKASEHIFSAIDEQTRRQIADLTKPFDQVHDQLRPATRDLEAVADSAGWARRLGVQTIDAASIAAVARTWGVSDTLRNLEEFAGIDRRVLRRLASELDLELDEDNRYADNNDTNADEPRLPHQHRPQISLGDLLGFLSVLLTLVIWNAQHRAAEQMEARLTEKIHQAQQNVEQKFDQVSRLVELLTQQLQPAYGAQFVARPQGAVIKMEKGSSAAIGVALPGQVVELAAHEGKWIEVNYFDFAAQKQHTGWALKKHFVRVRNHTSTTDLQK